MSLPSFGFTVTGLNLKPEGGAALRCLWAASAFFFFSSSAAAAAATAAAAAAVAASSVFLFSIISSFFELYVFFRSMLPRA
eukprot:jgi/Chrpa1/12458/Chrysochromulina_OHIO_Genome00003433-RA